MKKLQGKSFGVQNYEFKQLFIVVTLERKRIIKTITQAKKIFYLFNILFIFYPEA